MSSPRDLKLDKLQVDLTTAIEAADFQACDKLLSQLNKECDSFQFNEIVQNIIKLKSDQWLKFYPLDNVIKTLQTFQAYSVKIHLSRDFLSTEFFCRLLFEFPDYTLDLLKKTNETNLKFNNAALTRTIQLYAFMGLADNNPQIFIECLNYLSKKFGISKFQEEITKSFKAEELVRNDNLFVLTSFYSLDYSFILNHIFRWDSVNIFKNISQVFKEELDEEHISNILNEIVNSGAIQCAKEFLDKYRHKISSKQITQLAMKVSQTGDGKMMLALYNNDFAKAAESFLKTYIEDTNKNNEEIKIQLLKMLRFTPIEIVDNMINVFIQKNILQVDLKNIYEEIKKKFISVAPYFSRYKQQKDLDSIAKSYKKNAYQDSTTQTIGDIKFGAERRDLAKSLYARLSSGKNLIPSDPDFQSLPKSSTNNSNVAFLLEEICLWHCQNSDKDNNFRELRQRQMGTFVYGRYEWAAPLIGNVFYHSQSPNVKKSWDNFSQKTFYELTYKDISLNEIGLGFHTSLSLAEALVWAHGRAPVSDTWTNIENLFEKIWSMDIKKFASQDKEIYKSKLSDFYGLIAELFSLIGSTQPIKRGTGTFVEIMMGILHFRHGLEPPILKLEFPQLDVLDITFPLSDYQRFFPYFFEPCTLPEHLRQPVLSDKSVFDQIKHLYKDLNNSEFGNKKEDKVGIKRPEYSTSQHILLPTKKLSANMNDEITSFSPPIVETIIDKKDKSMQQSLSIFQTVNDELQKSKSDMPRSQDKFVINKNELQITLTFQKDYDSWYFQVKNFNKKSGFGISKKNTIDEFINYFINTDINNLITRLEKGGMSEKECASLLKTGMENITKYKK